MGFMKFLNMVSFRGKIITAFVMLIIATIALVGISSYNINKITGEALTGIDNLNVRYERTRRSIDSMQQLHLLSREMFLGDQVELGNLITKLHSYCWENNAYIKEQINNAKTMEELDSIDISYEFEGGEYNG